MQKELERRDSVDITQESTAAELESSFVEEGPELDAGQTKMLIVFQFLQFTHTMLTVSLGPLFTLIQFHYKVSEEKVHFLYSGGLYACLIAFYPTNMIIGKYGLRSGLGISLLGTLIGCILCCFINFNFNLFIAGYILIQFFMQSIHSAKGHFVNLFFPENQVTNSVS